MTKRTCHNFIKDYEVLEDFVEWLPELNDNEKYYVCLHARKKYMPELTNKDKTQLKRFTATKSNLINKIEQLECPIGSFLTKDYVTIPDEAIAIYITVNPRCMLKASYNAAKDIITCIQNQGHLNPSSEALSSIHKSKAKTHYFSFDIDGNVVADDIGYEIKDLVGNATVIQTRGGCHLLVKPHETTSKTWYNDIFAWAKTKSFEIDQCSDLITPIPGCNQAGYVPSLYEY
jgi:hypothetical protein